MATSTLILLILILGGSTLTNYLLIKHVALKKTPTVTEKIADTMELVQKEMENETDEVKRILEKDFVMDQQAMDQLIKKYNIKFKAP